MTGQIFHINQQRGMFSILTSMGSYIVFELIDSSELSRGDTITGTISGLGDAELYNSTTNEAFNAYIQKINCNEITARQGCFI